MCGCNLECEGEAERTERARVIAFSAGFEYGAEYGYTGKECTTPIEKSSTSLIAADAYKMWKRSR